MIRDFGSPLFRFAAASAFASVAAILPISPATAQSQIQITIPATTLDLALRQLARQAGISVGGTVANMDRIRTPAIDGAMSPAEALRRLLAATGMIAVQTGARSFRIETASRSRPAQPRPAARHTPPQTPAPRPPAPPPEPIIVTASKRNIDMTAYAGAATTMMLDGAMPREQVGGLENLLSALPIISSTNLGSGRNKLFIRGVADSSFNGPTQSTIGLYFGELRLIYSAPNPDLRMVDVESVELLEGPQGTLYGAGALGGVIRTSPKRAVPGDWQGGAWGSLSALDGGAAGYDLAAMVNAPLGDHVAARVVAYSGSAGGYVDDAERELSNINRSDAHGWRATVRAELGDDWTLDVEALQQFQVTRDGQYTDPDLPGLTRSSAIAQPFDSEIRGTGFTLAGELGDLSLVSSSGIFRSRLDTRFDASALAQDGQTLAFDERRKITLISNETRLSSGLDAPLSWVAGASLIHNADRRDQFLGRSDDPSLRSKVINTTGEYALFGEATVPLTSRISATGGARLVHSQTFSEVHQADGSEIDPQSKFTQFLPTAALSWRPSENFIVYTRYQRGYRAGGISIDDAEGSRFQISRFDPDKLSTIEAGSRTSIDAPLRAEASISAFYTRWNDIQADLLTPDGFSSTQNIGSARIIGITGDLTVHPLPQLQLSGAFFIAKPDFMPRRGIASGEEAHLPNVAEFGARASAELTLPINDDLEFLAEANVEIEGESFLDPGPELEVSQGEYTTVAATIALQSDDWTLALSARNLTNVEGNSFAFGNPFDLHNSAQATPLRPREVSLSIALTF